jgi:hypothetical protein
MAGTTGLEPATSAVTGQRSDQLSYVPSNFNRFSANRSPPKAKAKREVVTTPLFKLYQTNEPSDLCPRKT